jgi:hypothetical protein
MLRAQRIERAPQNAFRPGDRGAAGDGLVSGPMRRVDAHHALDQGAQQIGSLAA